MPSRTALLPHLQLVVTLFLALTAVQFVMVEWQPTSSYIVPTQQVCYRQQEPTGKYVVNALLTGPCACHRRLASREILKGLQLGAGQRSSSRQHVLHLLQPRAVLLCKNAVTHRPY